VTRAVIAALLLVASTARAQLDPCARYRAAEEETAYRRCEAQWAQLLPRANAELATPPEQIDGCHGEYKYWLETVERDPNDDENMVERLRRREGLDWCIRNWHLEHQPLEERRRRSAPGMIVLGAVFLGFGGSGLTAVGGAALGTRAYQDPVGSAIMGASAAGAGAFAVVGAVLLAAGAKRRR